MGMINLSLQQTEARKEGLLLLGDTVGFFFSEISAGFKDSFCTLVTDVLPNMLCEFRLC